MATMKGQLVRVCSGETTRWYLVMGKIKAKKGVVTLHDVHEYTQEQNHMTKVIVLDGTIEFADMR